MQYHYQIMFYEFLFVGYRLRVGMSGVRIPVRGEIFDTNPHRLCGPPSLLYNEYRVSFAGVKQPERGVNHSPPSDAEDKERADLGLYYLLVPPWTLAVEICL